MLSWKQNWRNPQKRTLWRQERRLSKVTSASRAETYPKYKYPIQEDFLNMSKQRPGTVTVLPLWRPSVVLNTFLHPPFIINGSDRKISVELYNYKIAFLVTLASAARCSELVTLSRADHNLSWLIWHYCLVNQDGANIYALGNMWFHNIIYPGFRNWPRPGRSPLVAGGSNFV